MPNSHAIKTTPRFTLPCAAAALALALGACDKTDRPEITSGTTEAQDLAARKAAFDQDIKDLKAKGLAPDKLEAAFAEARLRHGFPLPDNNGTQSGKTGPVAAPTLIGGALAKAALTTNYGYAVRTGHFGFGPTVTFDVPAGGTMTAWTTHPGAEDPMLVGYFKTTDLGKSYGFTQDIGVSDDDGGSTDAYLKWTNNTGATRTITLIAFAYNKYATGTASLVYHVWGTPTKTINSSLTAYQTNGFDFSGAPANCRGPQWSALNLALNSSQESEYGVLAVNTTTHRGGWIFEQPLGLTLQDILPLDYKSFILPIMVVDPGSTVFEAASYTASQIDVYSCTQP